MDSINNNNSYFEDDFEDDENDDAYRPKKMNHRKTMLPLYLYTILTKESSPSKHLKFQEIIDKLEEYPYELSIERKALSRTIHTLEDSGYGIKSEFKNGAWYDKKHAWCE